jgi:sugar lactone lactonase YvrE
VVYDSTRDVYYVSNIEGFPTEKDNRGFIARVRPDGRRDSFRWIASGERGVTLHAPKGMALGGDTLWVTDIDAVRGFDVKSGRQVASIDLAPQGAVFLNDLARTTDGTLYVTDTRVKPDSLGLLVPAGPARIYRIGADRKPAVALESGRLRAANGIVWDRQRTRFVVVSMGSDTLFAWTPSDSGLTVLATGPGLFDGVAVGPTGDVLVTSKATGSLHRVEGRRLARLIENLGDVADFDVDRKRKVVAIALTGENRVVMYSLGTSR